MNKKLIAAIACTFSVALAVCVGVFFFSSQSSSGGLELENNAKTGILPGIDLDKRKAELQETLDKSKIAFSVNTSPLFQGKEGNLLIENPENNAKLLVAELCLDGQEEPVYRSKALTPGTYLESVTLDKALDTGSYPATVYFKAYDIDTQELIGQTGAQILLTVEN